MSYTKGTRNMPIATIKNVKVVGDGVYSVTFDDGLNGLSFQREVANFAPGTEVEFTVQTKQSKKTGKDYKALSNIHIPEQRPQGGLFNEGAGRNKDWQIFVTGIVGRAMGSGKFNITDIRPLALAALEAFLEADEKHKSGVHAHEVSKTSRVLDDHIPF
jgi:hypothetical protein